MRESDVTRQLIRLTGHKDLAERWWIRPNPVFQDRTPQEQWDTDSEKVINYVQSIVDSRTGS